MNFVIFLVCLIFPYIITVLWLPFIKAVTTLSLGLFITIVAEKLEWLNANDVTWRPSFKEIFKMFDHIALSPKTVVNVVLNSFIEKENTKIGMVTLFMPNNFIVFSPAYVANVLRLLLAVVFLGSFIVRPFLMNPLSLLWRRVVESDKPIFTLVFGGIGGFATAINELMKHL
jgi:hypothetical protein